MPFSHEHLAGARPPQPVLRTWASGQARASNVGWLGEPIGDLANGHGLLGSLRGSRMRARPWYGGGSWESLGGPEEQSGPQGVSMLSSPPPATSRAQFAEASPPKFTGMGVHEPARFGPATTVVHPGPAMTARESRTWLLTYPTNLVAQIGGATPLAGSASRGCSR
jgi:hypothetical protein